MLRPKLELAEIFCRHGEAWRVANAGHLSLAQRRVMTAIEICRTAALGGHVDRCQDCAHTRIAFNSCRNRSCPKCQWSTAAAWLAAREAELLPVPYFHLVFTLPRAIAAIAYQNKANPHVHCIVPSGGISPDGKRWIACRPGSFLPVRVLSHVFRKLFVEGLTAAFEAGELQFFTDLVSLNDAKVFAAALAPPRATERVAYAKEPFAGPKQVLAYLARYTHRIAIANSRLLDLDETHVSFRWKDYRGNGVHKNKVMRIEIVEFIRRFLLHILPSGFHRIRHYGLFANGHRADKLALCRTLLDVRPTPTDHNNDDKIDPGPANHEPSPCPCCGGRMKVFESFNGPLSRSPHVRRLDAL
jgi:hypothetical protein